MNFMLHIMLTEYLELKKFRKNTSIKMHESSLGLNFFWKTEAVRTEDCTDNDTCWVMQSRQLTDAAEEFNTKCSENEEQKKEEQSKVADFW